MWSKLRGFVLCRIRLPGDSYLPREQGAMSRSGVLFQSRVYSNQTARGVPITKNSRPTTAQDLRVGVFSAFMF